jgi:hypothetical protein
MIANCQFHHNKSLQFWGKNKTGFSFFIIHGRDRKSLPIRISDKFYNLYPASLSQPIFEKSSQKSEIHSKSIPA